MAKRHLFGIIKKCYVLIADGDYMSVWYQNSTNYTFKVVVYCRMNISIYITFRKTTKNKNKVLLAKKILKPNFKTNENKREM